MGLLIRRPDWPERFAAVVAAAGQRPYRLGEWDCLRFACTVVDAMCDVDFWPRFAGQYSSRREALRAILAHGTDLAQAVNAVTGLEVVAMPYARRGDLVLFEDAAGEHLGICLGQTVGVLGADGLCHAGLLHPGCKMAWRVG